MIYTPTELVLKEMLVYIWSKMLLGTFLIPSTNLRNVATPHKQDRHHESNRNQWNLRFVTKQHLLEWTEPDKLVPTVQPERCHQRWYDISYARKCQISSFPSLMTQFRLRMSFFTTMPAVIAIFQSNATASVPLTFIHLLFSEKMM